MEYGRLWNAVALLLGWFVRRHAQYATLGVGVRDLFCRYSNLGGHLLLVFLTSDTANERCLDLTIKREGATNTHVLIDYSLFYSLSIFLILTLNSITYF